MNGKGDKPRPKAFADNWEATFGAVKKERRFCKENCLPCTLYSRAWHVMGCVLYKF